MPWVNTQKSLLFGRHRNSITGFLRKLGFFLRLSAEVIELNCAGSAAGGSPPHRLSVSLTPALSRAIPYEQSRRGNPVGAIPQWLPPLAKYLAATRSRLEPGNVVK